MGIYDRDYMKADYGGKRGRASSRSPNARSIWGSLPPRTRGWVQVALIALIAFALGVYVGMDFVARP